MIIGQNAPLFHAMQRRMPWITHKYIVIESNFSLQNTWLQSAGLLERRSVVCRLPPRFECVCPVNCCIECFVVHTDLMWRCGCAHSTHARDVWLFRANANSTLQRVLVFELCRIHGRPAYAISSARSACVLVCTHAHKHAHRRTPSATAKYVVYSSIPYVLHICFPPKRRIASSYDGTRRAHSRSITRQMLACTRVSLNHK